jgi:hypothetical protein
MPGARKSATTDDRTQSERFIETARALGCDEDPAAFDAKLRQIASYKPPPKAPKRKPAR